VARVVDVLDLFGLPVTSGAEGVLEGRQCTPGEVLGRPHQPLESPAEAGGAVAVPGGGDAARQDALNCASVKVCEGLNVYIGTSSLFPVRSGEMPILFQEECRVTYVADTQCLTTR
jgi:hypothetical protein